MHFRCITRLKTLPEKHLPRERPSNSVIGLLKVQLQENSPKFPRFDLVYDLLQGNHPFVNVPSFNEGRLRPTNRAMSDRGET